MVDLNDPEVIESLKYLLVSREEHIKAQTRPFDAKKNCWVEDHKDGFIFGEIQSADEKKGEFTVKTSRGEVKFQILKANMHKKRFLTFFHSNRPSQSSQIKYNK